MKLIELTGYGQVSAGDVLLIQRRNEFVAPVTVKDVLNKGTDKEEIILSKSKNIYFIVSMFLAGESWCKACSRLVNGKIYSISNSMHNFSTYEQGPTA